MLGEGVFESSSSQTIEETMTAEEPRSDEMDEWRGVVMMWMGDSIGRSMVVLGLSFLGTSSEVGGEVIWYSESKRG